MISFLQSYEWEEFQRALGRKTWRVRSVLIIRHDLPGGFNYLYTPEAVLDDPTEDFLHEAEKIAREEKSIFLKIEPLKPFSFSGFDGRESKWLQPRKTVFIDLAPAEEELLRTMREKTRYNIRLAERKGVKVTSNQLPVTSYFEKFWEMLKETASRDKFYLHERSRYEKLLEIRSENFSNELFFAEYRGEIAAAAMINFFRPSQTATYLHGASGREHREAMGPHLLHWRIMQEAKSRGFARYDFGGVDAVLWPGITRFKRGFGGRYVEYPKAIDIIYRPTLYSIYKVARKIL